MHSPRCPDYTRGLLAPIQFTSPIPKAGSQNIIAQGVDVDALIAPKRGSILVASFEQGARIKFVKGGLFAVVWQFQIPTRYMVTEDIDQLLVTSFANQPTDPGGAIWFEDHEVWEQPT